MLLIIVREKQLPIVKLGREIATSETQSYHFTVKYKPIFNSVSASFIQLKKTVILDFSKEFFKRSIFYFYFLLLDSI